MNTFTLSGTLVDAPTQAPQPNVSIALAQGIDGAAKTDFKTTTTDANGTWQFEVEPGNYVLRMSADAVALPDMGTTQEVQVFSAQVIAVVSSNITGIKIEARTQTITRTPENDARYIASLYQAVAQKFAEQTQNATTQEEVQEAIRQAQDILNDLLAPFLDDDCRANVPCKSCYSMCVGSTDPQCMYKCMYIPVPCY